MSAKIFRDLLIGVIATSATSLVVLGAFSLGLAESMVKTTTPTPPPTVTPQTLEFPTETEESPVATPTTAVEAAAAEVCPLPDDWVLTTVNIGDTIESLSRDYAVSPQEIKDENCLLSDNLPSGSSLYLPAQLASTTRTPTPPSTTVQCGPPWGWVRYSVQSGDNLFRLSLAFGVSVPQLQFANCLGSSTLIRSGQVIYVPNVPTRTPSATLTHKPNPTNVPSRMPAATVTTDTPPPEELPNGGNEEGETKNSS